MPTFDVTLASGQVIAVHAPDKASALEHAKAVAESHREPIYVGPKNDGAGLPNQLHRGPDHETANAHQPVSAVQVK